MWGRPRGDTQMSYRCSPSSGFYWSKEKITEAGTPTTNIIIITDKHFHYISCNVTSLLQKNFVNIAVNWNKLFFGKQLGKFPSAEDGCRRKYMQVLTGVTFFDSPCTYIKSWLLDGGSSIREELNTGSNFNSSCHCKRMFVEWVFIQRSLHNGRQLCGGHMAIQHAGMPMRLTNEKPHNMLLLQFVSLQWVGLIPQK